MRIHIREKEADKILENHLPFYAKLTSVYKAEFRKRVYRFIRNKTFRGGKDFKIKFEHIVAVTGSAIQISFGNDNYLLPKFNTIIIYEKVYQNPMTKNYHRGEVNPTAGIIVVSWKDFVYGYSTDEDNLNVGLHEMAHAYYFDIIKSRKDVVTNYDLLSKYMFISEKEIIKIRNQHSTLFRNYAGDNIFEFFAVSIEYFFEDGKEFRIKLPNLYRHLCVLLNQDSAEEKARGFNTNMYFKSTSIKTKFPKNDKSKSLNISLVNTVSSLLIYASVIVIVMGLFTFSTLGFQYILWFILAIAVFATNFSYLQLSKVIATNSHLFIIEKGFFRRKTLGIPYEGIITASIFSLDKYISIKYRDKDIIKRIIINPNGEKEMIEFERIMISKEIMLKMDGLRMPRIKSHKRRT
ncbi:MAG: hypothetical protein B6I18_04790 [Bacteroidetes bacterium 4572_112]|nr:MAG: hypothetical protein B6I18_04790 [Bacteroidetes bacterium 4572_112]